MKTIVINATVTLVNPYSCKLPVQQGAKENDFGQFPVMPVGEHKTGYIPASQMRGFLRRSATISRMEAAAEVNQHYKLDQIYSELIGQDAASEGQGLTIDQQQQIRDTNPVLDLFGTGLGVKSRLLVSHLMPTVNVLPVYFAGVRKDIEDTEEAFDLLADEEKQRHFERSSANSDRSGFAALAKDLARKLKKANDEDKPSIQAQLDEVEKKLEASKDLMGDMKNSSRTLVGYQAMPAGTVLKGRIVVERAKQQDMDIIMEGLNRLSKRPIMGAQAARGCGEISAQFDIKIDGKLVKTVKVGDFQDATVMEM